MTNLPQEVYAIIATYLGEGYEGDYFRVKAGKFYIWETREGKTYRNGVLHSKEDQPAVTTPDGSKFWYKNGKLHRKGNLPAVVCRNGEKVLREWRKKGKLYRQTEEDK